MSDRIFVVTPKVLRLRQAPSTGATILARLLRGQLIARLERTARSRWWRVFADTPSDGAFVGYVDLSYLAPWTRVSPSPPAGGATDSPSTDANA